MKKILNIIAVACVAMSIVSCDSVLDTESYTKQNTSNFPASVNDVNNELAAAYAAMCDLNNYPLELPYFVDDIMSDDNLGGGSDADKEPKAMEHFTICNGDQFGNMWKMLYMGIARANGIIHTTDNVEWNGDIASRNQAVGEGYFLRALYHFWLTQHFGNIPLINKASVPNPCPEADAETEIYPQILSDLYSASKLLNKNIDGHANKYAAEALLARVYLFYEGFYKEAGEMAKANPEPIALIVQDSIPANTTLSKDNVYNILKDVYGKYSLLPDYRSLWQYSNRVTQKDYAYTQDLPADQTFKNGNAEEIFQIRFGNAATYAGNPQTKYPLAYTNYISLYRALRCDGGNGQESTFPFGEGWGQATVSATLVNDWAAAETVDNAVDKRKKASIIDCANDLQAYEYTSKCTEETGYYTKKYTSVTAKSNLAGTKVNSWGKTEDYTWWTFEEGWNGMSGSNNMQEGHYEDMYIIRYADVLLMLTELKGEEAVSYMNEVRKRAGLPNRSYTWKTLQDERRWEFAFEGIRYQDLRRWSGKNANESSLICQALQKEDGQDINCLASWTKLKHMNSSWAARYVATQGFLPKPDSQVQLANGAMTQNPGWSGADAQYQVIY